MTSRELSHRVKEAVMSSATALAGEFGKSELSGFALCTDDDVRTLYHVACTKQWVKAQEDPDFGFLYTEWLESAKADPFKSLSKEVDRLGDIRYSTDDE